MKPIKITSFEQINKLYNNGKNICHNCTRERCASCTSDHFAICTQQAAKYANVEMTPDIANRYKVGYIH